MSESLFYAHTKHKTTNWLTYGRFCNRIYYNRTSHFFNMLFAISSLKSTERKTYRQAISKIAKVFIAPLFYLNHNRQQFVTMNFTNDKNDRFINHMTFLETHNLTEIQFDFILQVSETRLNDFGSVSMRLGTFV